MNRPMPPDWEPAFDEPYRFAPAPEIYDWLHDTILNPSSPLYNPEHEHLIFHSGISYLWAEESFSKQDVLVVGQAELVSFRVSGWQKFRQEAQMMQWFGHLPKAVITLSADYCRGCSDIAFCRLIEHELYHLKHKQTHMGPCYDDLGRPALKIRAHDVEEFHGVVERYGGDAKVRHMVDLANDGPTIGEADITQACGTCLRV